MPANLASALHLLATGQGWRPLAGGTDLMVLLNAGRLPYRKLLSLRQCRELSYIQVNDDSVAIGATVSYTQLQRHPVLQSEFPLLCQAASWTGGVANQNQGTLGGNVANASPAADSAPPLLIHDAALKLVSQAGERFVPYSSFHLGYKQFVLRPDELIHSIHLPRLPQNWKFSGRKVGTRRAQTISKVSFAAAAKVEGGRLLKTRVAFGSVAPVPLRCFRTEEFLRGKRVSQSLLTGARKVLAEEILPINDIRSTAAYRSQVAQNLLADFLSSLT